VLYKKVPLFITAYDVSIILKPWNSIIKFKEELSLQDRRIGRGNKVRLD
jgi:hypothetical protein